MAEANFWPTNTAWITDPREVPDAAKRLWDHHQRAWSRRRGLQRLYMRHFPDAWERVRECRTRVTVTPGENRAGPLYLVKREGCKLRPYCPACNEERRSERARDAARVLESCAPGKAKAEAFSVTVAARGHTTSPEWHARAMKDHRAFMRGVAHGIDRAYGGGLGMLATFQPYGNEVLTLPHPHVHAVVSGWAIRDGAPAHVEPLDFKGGAGAKERALAPILEEASRELGAEVTILTSNTWIDPARAIGRGAVTSRYRYNFKEVVNPLDWQYDREADTVRILNYAKPLQSRVIDAATLRPRILAYGAAYGDWTDVGREGRRAGGRPIDGWYGILARGATIEETRALMQHVDSHREDCACGECSTYGRPEWQPDLEEGPVDPIARPL